ncbi:MAG: translation elongation factor Ts [Treponema sp.]|nr:translation elongation factor Ts [Treponema sp.]
MEIKASDVKALRDITGAGMMECKKALVECNGDMAAAEKLLKEKGLAALEKRADRATSEGKIFIAANDKRAVICELTCETDFVSKNTDFIEIGNNISKTALDKGYNEPNDVLNGMLTDLATKIRENMTLRRLEAVEIENDMCFAQYVHSDGKTGVITLIKTENAEARDNAEVKEFAKDCCLHIAAFLPTFIRKEDVDEKYIEEQKEIFVARLEQDEKSKNKPENVKAGIINGQINKHLASICFLEQPFVKDDKVSVATKMEQVGKSVGTKLSLAKVITYQLGV